MSSKVLDAQQDYPLSEVPAEARRSLPSLALVLFGFTFFTATMIAGGQMGQTLGLGPELLLSFLLGNALLALYASALALVAFRSGLTTVLMSGFAFGTKGSRLADAVLGLTQIGWYAWGTDTVVRVLLDVTGWTPSLKMILIVAAGILFCSSAIIGYRGLEIMSLITVPLMAVLIVWSTILAWQHLAVVDAEPGAPTGMSLAAAITVVVGTFVSGATQSTNWTRYARSGASAVWVTAAAFFVGNGTMLAFGAIGALTYNDPDIVRVLLAQGFFWSALFMLLGNVWTTQDNTIYNFSVAGCHCFRSEKRRLMTVAGASLGTVMALAGFADHLVPFLLALGTTIPPLGGAILADFFWVRKGRFPALAEALEPDYRWNGIAAYAIGVLAAATLPGVPPLTGIVVAFLAHGLMRIHPSLRGT